MDGCVLDILFLDSAKSSAYLKNFLYSVKNCIMGLKTLLDPSLPTSVFITKKLEKCTVSLKDDFIHGSEVYGVKHP